MLMVEVRKSDGVKFEVGGHLGHSVGLEKMQGHRLQVRAQEEWWVLGGSGEVDRVSKSNM